MTAFYNEHDPCAAAWLRNLIAAGHIAPGIVDERPIQQIEAWELVGFTQCHFFAGIGVWSLALRRAGWPDDQPIWTGSCPCQPFSAAGQRKGISDERHLWPYWSKLIEQRNPPTVVGEQVASKDGLDWLDLVSADLEAASYAFGASDLCAAGFGGAHLRQRLYFVGLADSEGERLPRGTDNLNGGRWQRTSGQGSEIGGLADDDDARLEGRAGVFECRDQLPVGAASLDGRLVQPNVAGSFERKQACEAPGQGCSVIPASSDGGDRGGFCDQRKIATRWLDVDWLLCRNPAGEPSWRAVEPGTFPLDNAVAGRMGKLRAYGNALDAETATNFCEVVKEIADEIGV